MTLFSTRGSSMRGLTPCEEQGPHVELWSWEGPAFETRPGSCRQGGIVATAPHSSASYLLFLPLLLLLCMVILALGKVGCFEESLSHASSCLLPQGLKEGSPVRGHLHPVPSPPVSTGSQFSPVLIPPGPGELQHSQGIRSRGLRIRTGEGRLDLRVLRGYLGREIFPPPNG